MDNLISFEIITPMGVIYQGEVKLVTLPGSEEEFGVLRGHTALASSLKSSVVGIEKADLNRELIAIDAGYAKTDKDEISILTKGAVWVSGSSENEIEENLESAKKLIKFMSSDSTALAVTFSKLDDAKVR